MSAVVASSNDVAIVLEPLDDTWVKVRRNFNRPTTTRAMYVEHEGRSIWVAKKHLRIFEGWYYVRDFTLKEKPQQ